jgi:flagellin
MGFRIQNNIEALNAQRNLMVSSTSMAKSLQRLSSGYRINSAADDAAGLAISQQFRADIASYKVASQNVSEANALLQVAEGAMDQIGNILTRLKELATQAASANAGANIAKINAEATTLIAEMDRISSSTKYANSVLLNGSFTAATFQVGTSSATYDQISLSLGTVSSAALGLSSFSLSSATFAQAGLDTLNTAISTLSDRRGDVGAAQNRLSYANANLSITIENYTAAESTIRDVNMASEMTNFTKNQILVQAGTAMLAQANMAPQLVLSLFGNG